MRAQDVLFSKTQQRVLLALFAEDTVDGLTYAQILRKTAGGSGAIHRELTQFAAAGLVLEKGGPWQRVFLANKDHPVYAEIRAIAKKLLGSSTQMAPRKETLDALIARTLARKYLWWVSPEKALREQERLVAQIMKLGTLEDIQVVEEELGEDYFRKVLKRASPGQFDERSWTYWHYRLDLAQAGRVPSLPRRSFA